MSDGDYCGSEFKLSAPYRLRPDQRLLVDLRLALRALRRTLHHDVVGNLRIMAGHAIEHIFEREFSIQGIAPLAADD